MRISDWSSDVCSSDLPKTADPGAQEGEGEAGDARGNPLHEFASNLNEAALAGRIDPLIGRELEVERIIQVLCRRRKNNPLLVGEAGVGKTALAEGLAKRIVDKQVPEVLRDGDRQSTRLNSSH